MELGGAESALLGLLQSIDPERADVDVFIYAHCGELMDYIPRDRVRLLPEVEAYSLLEVPIVQVFRRGYFRLAMARLLGRFEHRCHAIFHPQPLDDNSAVFYQQRRTTSVLPHINNTQEYDLAISFLTPHLICLDHVRARKKVAWIHTDYSKVYVNHKLELPMWDAYDYIASISPDVTQTFCEVFPTLSHKVSVIENILSPAFIRERSLEPCHLKKTEQEVTLLTIGRYSYPKKMEDIPHLCRRICEAGINVRWYIIGYGSADYEAMLNDCIRNEGMEGRVILLGKQQNPYPFIRECDVYVQPSRYEGKSITVREAQILCKPVIVTNYPTAPSQIQDGLDGVIVPMELDACVDAMISFLNNPSRQQHLSEYLSAHDYGNEREVEKIYELALSNI